MRVTSLPTCRVVTHESEAPDEMVAAVSRVLGSLGMVPAAPVLPAPPLPGHLCVQVSGAVEQLGAVAHAGC